MSLRTPGSSPPQDRKPRRGDIIPERPRAAVCRKGKRRRRSRVPSGIPFMFRSGCTYRGLPLFARAVSGNQGQAMAISGNPSMVCAACPCHPGIRKKRERWGGKGKQRRRWRVPSGIPFMFLSGRTYRGLPLFARAIPGNQGQATASSGNPARFCTACPCHPGIPGKRERVGGKGKRRRRWRVPQAVPSRFLSGRTYRGLPLFGVRLFWDDDGGTPAPGHG